VFYSLKTL